MAHKAFKRAQSLDPISFDVPTADGEITFKCEDEIPAGVVFAFTDAKKTSELDEGEADAESEADDEGALSTVLALFDAAIVDEQIEQFHELLRAKAKGKGIGISMLMDIATWLGEQYAARPTGPSSDSGQSAKPNGSVSTGGALHVVTTYTKPEQLVPTT